MTTLPKFLRALWPKTIGWGNKIFRYIYAEITQTIFFHIFYHRWRAYLKPSTNFANILGKYYSQIFFAILPKRWGRGAGAFTWLLLNSYRTLQSIVFYFSIFFFLFINNLNKSYCRTVIEGLQLYIIVTKSSILDAGGYPDPPLFTMFGKVTFHLAQATAMSFNSIVIYGRSFLYDIKNYEIIFY